MDAGARRSIAEQLADAQRLAPAVVEERAERARSPQYWTSLCPALTIGAASAPLDEIGDMSLKTQAKVVRVLQEQTTEAVGGTARIKVAARVRAARNKDLQPEIRAGRFREDLHFRLHVMRQLVPPLRDRQEDIPLLADHFMADFAREYGRRVKGFDAGARTVLQHYPWPGNVRELRNVIERLMIMVPGDAISASHLSFLDSGAVPRADAAEPPGERQTLHEARDQFERELILRTLAEQQGNMSRTADVLGGERSNQSCK